MTLSFLSDPVSILGTVLLERQTLYTSFIVLHALAATISVFVGGYVIFSSKFFSSRRLFSLYFWSLVGMIVFLAGAMILRWTAYTNIEQVVFTGLFGLAIYMGYRGREARYSLELREANWDSIYIHHIGFTLISLFEGFIIVALINVSAPGWLVGLVAIAGVIVGRRAIDLAESRRSENIPKTNEKPF